MKNIDARTTLQGLLSGSLSPAQARRRLENKGPQFVIVTERPAQAVTEDTIYWHEIKTYNEHR